MKKAFILTTEQRDFAEANHRLVFKFLNEKRLDENEFYDVVIFGYLKAVKRFLEGSKKNYAFSTSAFKSMRDSVLDYYKSQSCQKRKAYIVSLDSPFLETTIAANDSLMNEFEVELLLHDIASVVSKQQMQVLLMKKDGYGVKEIAREQRIPMKVVQKLLSDIKDIVTAVCYDIYEGGIVSER